MRVASPVRSQASHEEPATTAIAALDRRVLHEAVADRLRELIIEGTLPPGAHLNERVLCEQLRVSRTPLREAFRTLAAEGVVELLPNRGAVVATLSREDAEHAFELMRVLESTAGKLAAQRATESEIAAVARLHAEMSRAHARRNLSAYYRLNREIHLAIVRAARNPELQFVYERLNARLQSLRFRSNLNHEKWDTALREHDDMLQALQRRDARRLGALLKAHLDAKREVVLAQWSQPALPVQR